MTINKVVNSPEEALADIFDGAVILCGGFGDVGSNPGYLFKALAASEAKNLTIVGNSPTMGKETWEAVAKLIKVPDWYADGAPLLTSGRIKKLILSNPHLSVLPNDQLSLVRAIQSGYKVEIELVAQGTLAERIRAARSGIVAFYTPTGVGTYVARGKETRVIDGEEYLLEKALKGDFSIIRAFKADRFGNLVYKGTGRTLNATMAGASTVTVAEVDELVELGELDPEVIITPGIYVDRVVVRPHQ
jgi:3-oxoadipate CoA-transferase alpha subunit